MKKDKNEELQSRREFFKSAAKAALPIIGAAVLASAPSIVKAAETTTSCNYGCSYTCAGGCSTGCYGSCSGTCLQTCMYSCKTTCDSTCQGTSKSW